MRQIKIVQSITNRSDDSISRYLLDIAHIELLQDEEETILASRARNGDERALEKLIKTNLRFVVSVAKQYQNKGVSLSDLISEGNMGLIKAAKRFDPTKGFKFISFAVYWIRQCILQSISEHKRIVRLPGNQIYDLTRISKAAVKLEQILERTPTSSELADTLALSEAKIVEILYHGGIVVSVELKSNTQSELSLLDTLVNQDSLCPTDELFKDSLTIDLIRLINKLPPKQALILKYCYGLDGFPQMVHDDIAAKIGLTSERIRQLRCKGIENLRGICAGCRMADYFNG